MFKRYIHLILFILFLNTFKTEAFELKNLYYVLSAGEADFSEFTIDDAELTSLNTQKNKNKPNMFSITAGSKINRHLSLEFSYLDLGKTEYIGKLSGATLKNTKTKKGLAASILVYPLNNYSFNPFIKGGLTYGRVVSKTTKENAAGVFSNPNNETASGEGTGKIIGAGFDYKLNNKMNLRFSHEVIMDDNVDYINNIDNGYIEKDTKLTQLGIVYIPKKNINKIGNDFYSSIKSDINVSAFVGKSKTSSRMSGGTYNGNTWNLSNNSVLAQVSGTMSDDKTDEYLRFSISKEYENDYVGEIFLADFGSFKSRSSNRGITGSGNAMTGAATKSVYGAGFAAGKKFRVDNQKLSISPYIGFVFLRHNDEIYNNLDFAGLGGSSRGPIEKYTNATYTTGLSLNYNFNDFSSIGLRYDYFGESGKKSTLGEGSLKGYGIGLSHKF